MEGYCVKCRAKREMVKAKKITTSNSEVRCQEIVRLVAQR